MLLRSQAHHGRACIVEVGSSLDRFGTGRQAKTKGAITGGMPLTRLVHRASTVLVATLRHMETYHVLAAGTVLWLLASAGATDSHLPAVLTATLTAAALLVTRVVRRRKEKL